MKRKTIWMLLCIPLFLSSCKKEYNVDFRVINDVDDAIYVMLQKTDTSPIDTSFISPGQEFIIHVAIGEKSTAEKYVFGLKELPIHNIGVQNILGNDMLCDPNALTCWQRSRNDNAKEFGSIILDVNQLSF